MAKIVRKDEVVQMFEQEQSAGSVVYRDAFAPPFADPERMTETQKKAWPFLKKHTGKGPKIGMIAAKGASKTHFGGAFANHQMQMYPGSMGCIISNSYSQALDNAGPILIKVVEQLGYEIEFYQKKKIGGRQYTSVFVITMADGVESFVLVRSFDRVDLLEGVELDWVWAEEIQDSGKDALVTVLSRNRGRGADNAVFLAGMPEEGTHWQYKFLNKIGIVDEKDYTGPVKHTLPDGEEIEIVGILYEMSVFENKHNVGGKYIQDLINSYDAVGVEKYVYGRRAGQTGNKVYYSYNGETHSTGIMSRLTTTYDPHRKLVVVFDFNVYPMSAAVFQPKPWADKWDDLIWIEGRVFHAATGKEVKPGDYAEPNREIFAQVDEFEVWPDDPKGGMTRGMARAIVEKYKSHPTTAVFLGDASGNRRETSAGATDWQIIGEAVSEFREPVVIRGLISNFSLGDGDTKYSNPLNRDAWNNANRLLKDGNGLAHVALLPSSKLPSGGLAAAVAAAKFGSDGQLDIRNERKMDRDLVRSHFGDIFKYGTWYFSPPAQNMPSMKDMSGSESPEDDYGSDSGWSAGML